MAPSEFWQSTLHECAIYVGARTQRMITQAWQAAALTRAAKLPPLSRLLADISPEHAQRYQDEQAMKMMHHMRLAAAQLNGEGG